MMQRILEETFTVDQTEVNIREGKGKVIGLIFENDLSLDQK